MFIINWYSAKVPNNKQWRKNNLFNKWCSENYFTCKSVQRWNWTLISHHIKINETWTKHLNIITETIKLLEENGVKAFWHWQWFCAHDLKIQATKADLDKCLCPHTRKVFHNQGDSQQSERTICRMGENIHKSYIS